MAVMYSEFDPSDSLILHMVLLNIHDFFRSTLNYKM